MALVTKAQVKADLQISASDTTQDVTLDEYIDEVGARIKAYCGQPIEQASVTETFDGNGVTSVTLGYHPMLTLSALSTRGNIAADWTAVDSSTYTLVNNTIYSTGGFTAGEANYRATFLVGYSASSVPTDLREIAREMVVVRVRESNLSGQGERRLGYKSVSRSDHPAIATTYDDLWPRWADRLKPYRKQHGG